MGWWPYDSRKDATWLYIFGTWSGSRWSARRIRDRWSNGAPLVKDIWFFDPFEFSLWWVAWEGSMKGRKEVILKLVGLGCRNWLKLALILFIYYLKLADLYVFCFLYFAFDMLCIFIFAIFYFFMRLFFIWDCLLGIIDN